MNVKKKEIKDEIIDILINNLYIDDKDGEIHGQYDTTDEIIKLLENRNRYNWHD